MPRKIIVLASFFLLVGSDVLAQTQKEKVADGKFWTMNFLMIGSTVYDSETTYYTLDRCGNNCKEGNPLMRPFVNAGRPWLYAVQGSIDAGVIYTSYQMKKKGHKFWYILPVALTVAHSAAGTHNLRLAVKF